MTDLSGTARTPEREQFEQWAHGKRLTTMPNGDVYAHVESQMAWEAWQAGREGLLEALRLADELVRTDGHTLTPMCQFNGCTCGGIEAYKVARSNYVRARREALLGTEKERKS